MPSLPDSAPPTPAAPARRWAVLAGLAAAVLLAHALLLGVVPLGLGDGADHAAPPLQVRRITLPPAPVAPVALPAPPAVVAVAEAVPRPVADMPPPAAPVEAPPPAAPAASQPAAPAPPPPEPVVLAAADAAPAAEAASAPAAAAAASAPAAVPAAATDGEPVPVYATRLPPPVRLRYDLKRGPLGGDGELVWRHADGRYQLAMEGTAFSLSLIAWTSQGGIDATGIAPDRFVDRRRSRDVRAANFQRDKGLITFSGPAITYPLLPGAQDRLSWMLQLPAIVAADPAAFGPGARIAMFVAGARGDGDIWRFTVQAVEAVDVPAGRVQGALRLRREPRKPYDTQVDVWLDPARAWLPVRVRLAVTQTDDTTEFLLREQQTP